MAAGSADHENGKGKVPLSGKGEWFNRAARAVPGRKSFFLLEAQSQRPSVT